MTQETAIELATSYLKRKGYGKYIYSNSSFDKGHAFNPELPSLQASSASWIVRFQRARANRNTSVIDDGEQIICVEIDAVSATAKLLKGL
jgi:hypothetical protein